MKFQTKDSGKKQVFESGYQRDTQDGKPRFDLIPVGPLTRIAELYARGADKYGDRNWELGSPVSRFYASALRHLFKWATGHTDEDHLAAVCWNVLAIMHHESNPEFNDVPWKAR